VYEPVLVTEADGDVFLEAHADIYGHSGNLGALARAVARAAGLEDAIDWVAADREIATRSGVPRAVTRR
jgi:L,D-transpeptidase ErfK/SrfK